MCECDAEYMCNVHNENNAWTKAGRAAHRAYAYSDYTMTPWEDLHDSAKLGWISLARDVVKTYRENS